MPTAPRITHNSDLCTQFIAAHKVSARYPRVTEQVETMLLEKSKLVRFGYNPSIITDGTHGLLMAYRYHDGDTLATKLALAELGVGGSVISNRTLEIPSNGEGLSFEDPKLFRWKGEIWIEWVQSTWPNFPLSSVVKYGRLDGNKIVNIQQVEPPAPKAVEKNHVPMPNGDTLSFIYECDPEQVIFQGEQKPYRSLVSPGPTWAYGAIRGGTVPIAYEGKLLRFFHSGLDNEFGPQRRRYFMGALLMEQHTPFACIAVSKRPVVYGSELDNLTGEERRKCVQYKRQVVFPGGAIERNGEFWVSVGVNDSACAILRIKPEQLNFQ